MNLTPEQKAIGKENFLAAVGSKVTRRAFLQAALKQGLTPERNLGGYYFKYGQVSKPLRVAILGTGDEGSVLIGALNPRYVQVVAIADIRPYNQFRAFHGDVSSSKAAKVRPGLMKKYGWKSEAQARSAVKVYSDYKDLLADAKTLGIEGVIIGLPLHLHAPAAVEAMKQGCHVLTEKLMGHSIANCKEMVRAAQKYQKHLTVGHQRHYNILYDNAVDLIKRGVLGKLHYIRAQWHRGNLPGNDSWQQPLPQGSKTTPDVKDFELENDLKALVSAKLELQEKIDAAQTALNNPNIKPPEAKKQQKLIDGWKKEIEPLDDRIEQKKAQMRDGYLIRGIEGCKKAEDYGYFSEDRIQDGVKYHRSALEELIRWRLWNRTGGGLMAELGSHQLDAASIFVAAMHDGKKQFPLSVSASGAKVLFTDQPDRDVDDHVSALYEFPAPGYDPKDELGVQRKITVAYSTINGNGFGGYGEEVYGDLGTLLINLEEEAQLFKRNDVNSKTRVVQSASSKKYDIVLDEEGDPLSSAIGYQAIHSDDVSKGYREEIEHWVYCIRQNETADSSAVDSTPTFKGQPLVTRCRGEVAIWDAIIALATNIAVEIGETVVFNPDWFDPSKDETPEHEFASKLVERKANESDEDFQKRVDAFAALQVPSLDKYSL